jgi:hypothetical protein
MEYLFLKYWIGLCINRSEIYKIIEDPNMPNNVKKPYAIVSLGLIGISFLMINNLSKIS